VAAIAGTALSSLKPPEQTVSEVTAPVNPAATPEKPGRQGLSSTLTLPLPLAEELVSLETDLVGLEAMTPGLTQATFFYDLDTGNYIDINGTQAISAASTIKLPVLVALLEAVDAGTISLQQPLTLREDLVAGGSGDMQTYEVGSQYTVLEVATQMIVHSDNTATNLVIDALGGIGLINQRFKAWGLEHTILKNLLPDLDGTNTTSPADLVRVLALVDQGEILGMRSRDRLFSILQRTYNRSLIPEGLADESAIAYNKTGDIGTMLGDIALLDMTNGKRYILGILVTRPYNDGRANELIRRVAGRVHEEMNQSPQPAGVANPPTPASPSVTPSTAPDPDSPTSSQTDVDVQITPVDSVPNPADSLPDEYLIPEDDVYSDPQLPPEGGGF
jgi:beta-lactamase class A